MPNILIGWKVLSPFIPLWTERIEGECQKKKICIKRESNPRRVDAARHSVATTQVTTTPLMLFFLASVSLKCYLWGYPSWQCQACPIRTFFYAESDEGIIYLYLYYTWYAARSISGNGLRGRFLWCSMSISKSSEDPYAFCKQLIGNEVLNNSPDIFFHSWHCHKWKSRHKVHLPKVNDCFVKC